MIYFLLSVQLICYAQEQKENEERDYYKAFYSTFFNQALGSNVFEKKLEIQLYLAGDSLDKPYRAEIVGDVLTKSTPVRFVFKIKKIGHKFSNSLNKANSSCYFLYINDFRYSNLLDSIDNGTSQRIELEVEELIQNDILKSSQDSLNRICLFRSQSKKLKNIYFLNSVNSAGKIKIKISRKDKKFMKDYNHSIEEWMHKVILRAINQSYLFVEDQNVAYKLFEL